MHHTVSYMINPTCLCFMNIIYLVYIVDYTLHITYRVSHFKCCMYGRFHFCRSDSTCHRHGALIALSYRALVNLFMSTLDHYDSDHNGLLDAVVTKASNPFLAAKASLSSMLLSGDDGPLGLLTQYFQHVPACIELIRKRAVEIGYNMLGQLMFRFHSYENFPMSFARMVHPGLSLGERYQVALQFFALKVCCMGPDFELKVFNIFESALVMFRDKAFLSLVRLWAYVHKFTNMHCERLLASTRLASSNKGSDCTIERKCASGLLALLLQEHHHRFVHSDLDPRYEMRSEWLQDAVPLACATKKEKSKPASGFVYWIASALYDGGLVLDGVPHSHRAIGQAIGQ